MNGMPDQCPPVQLRNVTKVYASDGHRTVGVREVSFAGPKSTLSLLLGPSGSGKTTLLALMAGFLQPTAGEVFLFGRDVCGSSEKERQITRARQIGFVFQSFRLIDALTVSENIGQVLRFNGYRHHDRKDPVRDILRRLSIDHLSERFPPSLSQGEKQRVAIARAIIHSPSLLLADEPTANLESSQGAEVLELLLDYARKREACVVVASHDLRLKSHADAVYWVEDGKMGQMMIEN